jgi:hypothetical protein
MSRWKDVARVVFLLLLGCASALAQAQQPQETVTEVTRVALFKNGMGYFTREGELPKKAGPFVIRPLPASSHGTFWCDYDESVKMHGLRSRKASRPESVKATSLLDLRRGDVLDKDAGYVLEKDVETVELAGILDRAPRNRTLTLTYVAKGIAWAPSYRIDISAPDTAAISAKALVINEVEDLEDVTILLVTGFPHIQFADVPSPLSLKLNLAQFFQYLVRPPEAAAHHITVQQAAYGPVSAPAPGYTTTHAGQVTEDFFLYPVENVDLAKGETGYYPVLTASVPYKHIYQWDIPDYVNQQDRYQRPTDPSEEERPQVWHSIRLENSTALPWTTAPAMTLAQGQIVGQDTLTYTPVEGSATLKLTRAVEVAAEEQELEIERVPSPIRYYGYQYEMITIEGELRIENFKDKPIATEISKTFSGEFVSSTPDAHVQQLARGLKTMNPTTVLTWHLEVNPDEEKEITYRYTVLIRR